MAGLLLVTGCQPTVYLMPTPEALRSGMHDPFAGRPEVQTQNTVTVAYATNRLPVGLRDDRNYITLFDDNLRLGKAQASIGTQQFSAEELHRQSTTSAREFGIPLTLETATEIGRVGEDDDVLPADAQAFFARINDALERSAAKDLIVYVHGANNNFYRSVSQGAQFHHFTGRNAVVLVYSWPSAASLLRYAVDVNNALDSFPVFSRLLELLARHTHAQQIDILAYSAGAQILSPALARLAQAGAAEGTAELRQRLRLGEIYFAAPDVDFGQFVDDLRQYIDLPRHVTLTVNPGDVVLGMAASKHGVSRAGRPDPDELTEEERELVTRATREMAFDVLWIDPDSIPGLAGGSHAFWYDHPWVSTDVLLQLLYNVRPAERGLELVEHGDTRLWRFPGDYGERVDDVLSGLQQKYRRDGS